QHHERSRDDGRRSVRVQLCKCSTQGRASAHDVVHDCDTFVPYSFVERRGQDIPHAVQSLRICRHHTPGEAELDIESVCDELSEEGAANQRTADRRYTVWPNL